MEDCPTHSPSSAGASHFSPSSSSSSSNKPSISEVSKDAAVIILAGVAVIVGLLLVVYIMILIFDKCCGSFSSLSAANDGHEQYVEGGTVARDAGLTGMRKEERRQVLEQIFPSQLYTRDLAFYCYSDRNEFVNPSSSAAGMHDLKNVPARTNNHGEEFNNLSVAESNGVETVVCNDLKVCKADDASESAPSAPHFERDKTVTPDTTTLRATLGEASLHDTAFQDRLPVVPFTGSTTTPFVNNDLTHVEQALLLETMPHQGMDDYNSNCACVICISEYEEGEEVIVGERCNHMFHKECLLEWLAKHDICPVCREKMLTSTQLRATAEVVLGLNRTLELVTGLSNLAIQQQRPPVLVLNDDDPNNNRSEMTTRSRDMETVAATGGDVA